MNELLKFLIAGCVVATTITTGALADTNIVLWSNLGRGGENIRTQVLDHVLTTFEEANPGVTVEVVVIDFKEMAPMLLRAARAEQMPDISMMFSPILPIPIAAGIAQPLDEMIAAWSAEDRDDVVILPNAYGENGSLYALPLELRLTGIMYRKDLLDAAGIEPPRTLDELAEVAGALRAEDGVGIAIGFSPAEPDAGMDWFVPTLIGLGSKPLNEDGSANFDTPEMRKLLSWIHGLVHDKNLIPLDVALLGDDDVQLYADSGKTVFLPKMTHRLERIRQSSGLGEAYQMMDAPTFDPDHPAPAYLQGWNLLIPTGSAHPDLAWKLMEHWTSPEIQLYQAEHAGYIPVRVSVAQDPALADRGHIRWALEYASKAPLEFDWPENYFALYTTLAEMVSEVISERMTIDEAIAAAEKSYDSR